MATIQDIIYFTRLLGSPYLIGYYQGHQYLSEGQIEKIQNLLVSEDIERSKNVVKQYEHKFATLVNRDYACSFASGRMAFFSLLKSLEIGPGDEVIIPGFTCAVVANAIYRCGATPVYADIDPETLGSDADTISRCITAKTKMIVAQHSFGIPCNIAEIADLSRSKGIFLVEDSALSLDSRIHGKPVGTWGDAAFFSTDHSKPLNTIIGGILVTSRKDIIEKVIQTNEFTPGLRLDHQKNLFSRLNYERKNYIPSRYPRSIIFESIRAFLENYLGKSSVFLEEDYTRHPTGSTKYPYPAKMPPFLAQLGLFELERWQNEKRKRKEIIQRYLQECEAENTLIHIPTAYYDTEKDIVPLRFIFRSSHADKIREKLKYKIDMKGMWFLAPVICCPEGPQGLGYKNGNCTGSEKVCSDIVNMPCVLPDEWDTTATEIFRDILTQFS
jgi:dTDP-4-amino-4,6-dideoxygalactose transaminase